MYRQDIPNSAVAIIFEFYIIFLLCCSGVDTHFLSAQECIMAGHFQNQHPNACRHASSGYFGSKFVTVCVTGQCLIYLIHW